MSQMESQRNQREMQREDEGVGFCHICYETFETKEELSKHLERTSTARKTFLVIPERRKSPMAQG